MVYVSWDIGIKLGNDRHCQGGDLGVEGNYEKKAVGAHSFGCYLSVLERNE